jgi:hypothetical protein
MDSAAGVDPDFDDDGVDMRFLEEEVALEGAIKLHPGGWALGAGIALPFRARRGSARCSGCGARLWRG